MSETSAVATKPGRGRKLTEANLNRRQEILQAAERILQRQGYSNFTARAVANEAGLSLGHITYNFAGMDEVLSETYRMLSARLRAESEAVVASASGDPLARLDAFVRAGFSDRFLNSRHLRLRVDFWSAAMTSPEIARTDAELYAHYRRDLLELLYLVAGDDPTRRAKIPAISDTVMATLDGLWLDWLRRRNDTGVKNGLDTTVEMVRAMLG